VIEVSSRSRLLLRIAAACAVLGLAFHAAHSGLGLGGSRLDKYTDEWLYDALVSGAALACLVRGLAIEDERGAWLLLGAALMFNACGEICYSIVYPGDATPPTPSIADAFNLAYYPCVYVGLVLLVRPRLLRFSPSAWMDGAVAAATTAAAIAAIVFAPIAHASTGSTSAVATTLAYPLGDLLLLSIVTAVFALSGWRPGRAWLLLGLALIAGATADTIFAYQEAKGTYTVGTLLDSLWPASAVAIAFAAWQRPRLGRHMKLEGMRMLVVPGLFAVTALGLLVFAGVHHVAAGVLALAGVAMLLVIVRAAWTFRENVHLLESFQREAITDLLTGLGNRRRLNADLDRAVAGASREQPVLLLMFDLNGFKLYNDSFGHMAGDELLAHLGHNLAEAVAPRGVAYRLGGDEFCVLAQTDPNRAKPLVSAACAALSSSGNGFHVDSSVGQVLVPAEASTPSMALRLADDRMYAHKGGDRVAHSAREQAHDVLRSMLRERVPELAEHLGAVARLAADVGRRLELSGEQLDELMRAADLYDIGKAAIPEEILKKPGPLDENEWAFLRRHPLIGERILGAAPALGPVAAIVRSCHERWDGRGYPDGLSGETIPIGARIIHVCDAFRAMTSERPYAPVMTADEAIEEVRRNAGTQFDPTVAQTFVDSWFDSAGAPAANAARAHADIATTLRRS
jgi:two-component system, cell cycle response regulator